jgi:DNA-binding response OmpR family regulator
LIIVERELPMVNGEDPCLRIRQASYLPIIVLGSREEAVEALELGADVYMTKPLSLNELVARVHALLRRKPRHDPLRNSPEVEIGDCPDNGGNGSNRLNSTEFRLTSCRLLDRGRLLGYARLISEVWRGKEVSVDTLHFYMRRLRSKLANVNIFGLRGVSYCFSGDDGAAPQ